MRPVQSVSNLGLPSFLTRPPKDPLDPDHGYLLRVSGKGVQISDITGEHGTVWLGQCDDQRVNRRSLTRPTPELGRSTGKGQRHRILKQTGSDELVQGFIATGATLK